MAPAVRAAIPRRLPAASRSAERCRFASDELALSISRRTRRSRRSSPQETLASADLGRARPERYPEGIPTEVTAALHHELTLIGQAALCALFPDRDIRSSAMPGRRISCARGAARRPTRRSAMSWASRRSIRAATTCCSSASSARSAASRPISTSISSTSGAKRSSSGSINTYGRDHAGLDGHRHPLPRQGRAARCRQGHGPARGSDRRARRR